MEIFKTTPKIPFLKYKYLALALTALIVLAGVVNIVFFKGLKLGVDFGEGTLIRVKFKDPVPVGDVRALLREVGLGTSTIQEVGRESREYQIRTVEVAQVGGTPEAELEAHEQLGNRVIEALVGNDGQAEKARGLRDLNAIDVKSLAAMMEPAFPNRGQEIAEKVVGYRTTNGNIADYAGLEKEGVDAAAVSFLKDKTYLGKLTVLSRESVGPQVGRDLRKKATLATFWSLIGMLVYIAFRFQLANGVAAILTLTQDVLITISIYSFSGREINLPIIAGILTIVGFSINDTIVIFDRIRENKKIVRKESLESIMNLSLNQCLGRTLITSGTVFLTVLALFLFGGEVINDFAFIMLVGAIEGIYSTVFMSCPVVLWWQKLFPSQRGRRR
jgi:preprotein translocase subunit SecF